MNARQLLARAKGVSLARPGCLCCCCGPSPYAAAGRAKKLISPSFTNHDLFWAPQSDLLCDGCVRLLGGSPNKVDPPIRMISIFAQDSSLRRLARQDFWELLISPPTGQFILSWATSMQKHHWLRAGISTADRMEVGSDDSTIRYRPDQDLALLRAVEALLAGPKGKPVLSRKTILSGAYSPSAIQRYGVARWAKHERVVAQYRGQNLLDLVCWCAPASEQQSEEEELISNIDEKAAELLSLLVDGSRLRREEGKMFWGGYLRHRVERFARLPLDHFVSRLIDELRIDPISGRIGEALAMIEELDIDGMRDIEMSFRRRGGLVVALCFDRRKRARNKRDGEFFFDREALRKIEEAKK